MTNVITLHYSSSQARGRIPADWKQHILRNRTCELIPPGVYFAGAARCKRASVAATGISGNISAGFGREVFLPLYVCRRLKCVWNRSCCHLFLLLLLRTMILSCRGHDGV